jgi:hypothetical protein
MTSVNASPGGVGGKLLVFDWVSQPSELWPRCRLWKIFSHAQAALASSTHVVHRLRSSSSVASGRRMLRDGFVGVTDGSIDPITIGTPAVENHGGMGHHPTPVLPTSGRLPPGLHTPRLHQTGDRFVNDPDGNAWILQERPDPTRRSTVQRPAAGGHVVPPTPSRAWMPGVRVWSTRASCRARSSGGVA